MDQIHPLPEHNVVVIVIILLHFHSCHPSVKSLPPLFISLNFLPLTSFASLAVILGGPVEQ
jgi:hypothetical protein